MNFDRNTVIGFVVLAALFFGYFYCNNKEQAAFKQEQARLDSIANANKPKPDTLAVSRPASRSSAGFSDFKFIGSNHATASNPSPNASHNCHRLERTPEG